MTDYLCFREDSLEVDGTLWAFSLCRPFDFVDFDTTTDLQIEVSCISCQIELSKKFRGVFNKLNAAMLFVNSMDERERRLVNHWGETR